MHEESEQYPASIERHTFEEAQGLSNACEMAADRLDSWYLLDTGYAPVSIATSLASLQERPVAAAPNSIASIDGPSGKKTKSPRRRGTICGPCSGTTSR